MFFLSFPSKEKQTANAHPKFDSFRLQTGAHCSVNSRMNGRSPSDSVTNWSVTGHKLKASDAERYSPFNCDCRLYFILFRSLFTFLLDLSDCASPAWKMASIRIGDVVARAGSNWAQCFSLFEPAVNCMLECCRRMSGLQYIPKNDFAPMPIVTIRRRALSPVVPLLILVRVSLEAIAWFSNLSLIKSMKAYLQISSSGHCIHPA